VKSIFIIGKPGLGKRMSTFFSVKLIIRGKSGKGIPENIKISSQNNYNINIVCGSAT
jgi:hypothetical protein